MCVFIYISISNRYLYLVYIYLYLYMCVYMYFYIYTHTRLLAEFVNDFFFNYYFWYAFISISCFTLYKHTDGNSNTSRKIPASNSEILLCILYQPSFLSFLLKQLANSCSISWQGRKSETLLNLELSFKLQAFNGVKRNCRFCELTKIRCRSCRAQLFLFHHHCPDVHLSPS